MRRFAAVLTDPSIVATIAPIAEQRHERDYCPGFRGNAERLDALARKLDRSVANVAEQAIEDFVAREGRQIAEIEAGILKADSGDFASAADVAAVLAKYIAPIP